jgi:LIVCS family branched-chain amino acid:cation transporter
MGMGIDWVFLLSAFIILLWQFMDVHDCRGTLLDFLTKKVSPIVALIYAILIIISVTLPSPKNSFCYLRNGNQPYFEISSLWTSVLYFTRSGFY